MSKSFISLCQHLCNSGIPNKNVRFNLSSLLLLAKLVHINAQEMKEFYAIKMSFDWQSVVTEHRD